MATAAALSRCGRRPDRVYRIGGDEFALLPPGADRAAGGRLLEQATAPLWRSVPEARFSAGIALAPEDGETTGILFGAADSHLYQNKRHRGQRGSRARAQPGSAWKLEFSETSSVVDAP